jgi:predicted DNA-binding transcriptional regulator YafY
MQALLLGAQWVSQYGDTPLSKAAIEALNKVLHVLPANTKSNTNSFSLRVGPPMPESLVNEDLSILRNAIANQKKIYMVYKSENKENHAILWPFTIGYFTNGRILVAWCEKQNNYQHYKTDKITSLTVLNERYPRSKTSLFREWQLLELDKLSKKQK